MECTHTFVDCNNEVIIDVVRELLERGAEDDARDHGLATPLHRVWYGRITGDNTSALAVVRLLLEYNADGNAKSSMGRTSLHQVVAGKHEIIDVLLEHGANVNARDNHLRTALHFADRSRNAEKLLIAGVDVDAVDGFSQTALQRATLLCFEGVVVAMKSFKKKSRIRRR